MSEPAPVNPVWREEASPDLLAHKLARAVSRRLAEAIEVRGTALLAVSGGKTPLPLFKALSSEDIEWGKVTIILADERFVPPQSSRSNEHLVTLGLLQNRAAKAHFEGLYGEAETVELAAQSAGRRMQQIDFPPDVTVLGMGLDGHTASLFADWENISEGLNMASDAYVLAVNSDNAREPRLTLPLARIAASRFIALLIEGYQKKDCLLNALEGRATGVMPIVEVIRNSVAPVHIFWAPREATSSEGEQ